MLKKTIIYAPLGLFLMALLMAYSGIPFAYFVLTLLHEIPAGDKLAHLFIVAALTWSMLQLLQDWSIRIGNREIPLGVILVLIIMTLEEFLQLTIPYRNFEILDLLSNYLGIILACCINQWSITANAKSL